MPATVFWTLQALSILVAWILLAEYGRIRRERDEFLSHLGGPKPKRRLPVVLALYVCTTLLIVGLSAYVFFR